MSQAGRLAHRRQKQIDKDITAPPTEGPNIVVEWRRQPLALPARYISTPADAHGPPTGRLGAVHQAMSLKLLSKQFLLSKAGGILLTNRSTSVARFRWPPAVSRSRTTRHPFSTSARVWGKPALAGPGFRSPLRKSSATARTLRCICEESPRSIAR